MVIEFGDACRNRNSWEPVSLSPWRLATVRASIVPKAPAEARWVISGRNVLDGAGLIITVQIVQGTFLLKTFNYRTLYAYR